MITIDHQQLFDELKPSFNTSILVYLKSMVIGTIKNKSLEMIYLESHTFCYQI